MIKTNIFNETIDTSVICNAAICAIKTLSDIGNESDSVTLLFGIEQEGCTCLVFGIGKDLCCVREFNGDYSADYITEFNEQLENTNPVAYEEYMSIVEKYRGC